MASPSEKLAEALEALHSLQQKDIVAIKTRELKRMYRERLLANGYLSEVTKGWYIPRHPNEKKGDSTSWYSSYWEFCSRFLNEKYKDKWVVSPEQSVQIHAGNWSIPKQLLARSTKAANHIVKLPFDTSLFTIKTALPLPEHIEVQQNIRLYTLSAALVFCSANTFKQSPIESRTALSMVRDSSEILSVLLSGGHSTYAGRLAGAFRNIGRDRIAQDILETMTGAGYDVRETDPFEKKLEINLPSRERSPYVNRLHLMWNFMRATAIKNFPKAPGIPKDKENYLKAVDDIYVTDAYHSLSIERYRVSAELIERVRTGQWNHHENEADRTHRDAMAARGYWQAFQVVKESVQKIISGENAGKVVDQDHGRWYRELFAPSVAAGILKATDLAGYRTNHVYIGGSKHVPLNVDALRDAMPTLFDLLEKEPEASVRAVLGHFIFVYIHPYMDGNGRMGRFMMNAMLSSGGYPWTVIPVQQRDAYMEALESASTKQNIEPFAKFLGSLVDQGLKGITVAKIPE